MTHYRFLRIPILASVVLVASATATMAGGSLVDDGDAPAALFHDGLQVGLLTMGAVALAAATILIGTRSLLSRLAVGLFVVCAATAALHLPALAQVVATPEGNVIGTTSGSTVVTLPYGEWIAGAQAGITTLLTLIATALLAWLPMPIRWVVNLYGVERLVKDAVGFAIAATPGASRDAKLTVDVGSQVLARAFQKAVDDAPPRLIKAAGGIDGLQEKILAQIPLAENVTAHDVARKTPSTPELKFPEFPDLSKIRL